MPLPVTVVPLMVPRLQEQPRAAQRQQREKYREKINDEGTVAAGETSAVGGLQHARPRGARPARGPARAGPQTAPPAPPPRSRRAAGAATRARRESRRRPSPSATRDAWRPTRSPAPVLRGARFPPAGR